MSDIVIVDDESSVVVNNNTETAIVEIDNSTIVVSTAEEVTVVESESESIVVSVEQETTVVSVGEQGPAGPQGPVGPKGDPGTGISVDVSLLTNQIVSSYKVMTVDPLGFAIYADPLNPDHVSNVLGVSINAVTDNTYVTIRSSGFLEDAAWNWTSYEPVFLGANGALTQTPPTVGFLLIVATVISPTKLLINIKEPIVLS